MRYQRCVCILTINCFEIGPQSRCFWVGAFIGNLDPLATVGIEISRVAFGPSSPSTPTSTQYQRAERGGAAIVSEYQHGTVSKVLKPPVRGVVLKTYGAGNVTIRTDFLEVLKEHDRGIIIVNCTQCSQGTVTSDYTTGSILNTIGVVSGSDMTPERSPSWRICCRKKSSRHSDQGTHQKRSAW